MAVREASFPATHYLNVDLDISSRFDLEPLIAAFGKQVDVLYLGRDRQTYVAHLELSSYPKTADAAIRRFCGYIRALPRGERRLWDTAKMRSFSVGIQAGTQPHCHDIAIAAKTVRDAAMLNAGVVFSIYAPEAPPASSGSA